MLSKVYHPQPNKLFSQAWLKTKQGDPDWSRPIWYCDLADSCYGIAFLTALPAFFAPDTVVLPTAFAPEAVLSAAVFAPSTVLLLTVFAASSVFSLAVSPAFLASPAACSVFSFVADPT